MRVIIDGVIFQHEALGRSSTWSAILARMNGHPDFDVSLLNRGGAPLLDGFEIIDFPSYKLNANTAADSLLLDKICKEENADVFLSTLYTTPITVPSVMLVLDGLTDEAHPELSPRQAQERQIAASHASYYVCTSEQARADLEVECPGTFARSALAFGRLGVANLCLPQNVDLMTACLHKVLRLAHEEAASCERQAFVREWQRLRTIQADVDPCRIADL